MKNTRHSPIRSLLSKLRSVWQRVSARWLNKPDPVPLPSSETLEQLRTHILSVHKTFGQQLPSEDELGRFVGHAVKHAGSVEQLNGLVASGGLAEITDVRPLKLEMDLLNKCNLRCPMCMMSHPSHYKQPLQRMSMDVFERLADELFWHVHALSFTFGAEPLLHPEFTRFVEIAGRYRIPEIYAVTNGILLTDAIAQAIVKCGMHVLAVSIDAACPDTYEKIRVGGDWDQLMRNLQNLERVKRNLGSRKPHLELTFVMMKTNIAELPKFVDMAAMLGANSVNATHMVPFESLAMAHESCSLDMKNTNEMLVLAREKASRLGLKFTGPPLFGASVTNSADAQELDRFSLPVSDATRKAGHCPFPWHFAAIDMRGDVVPCGWWNHEPGMGSIRTESFLSIWQNKNYQNLRAEHLSGALRSTCRNCPAAGIGYVDNEGSFLER